MNIKIDIIHEENIPEEVILFMDSYFNLTEEELLKLEELKVSYAKGLTYRQGAYSISCNKILINLGMLEARITKDKEKFLLNNVVHELTHWLQNLRGTLVPYEEEPRWMFNPSEGDAAVVNKKGCIEIINFFATFFCYL